jgi:periplasmic protein TonB
MEPKKNPKIDLNSKRGMIFNLSLVLSLVVVITAFQWRAPIPEFKNRVDVTDLDDGIVYIAPTVHEVAPKPKPIIQHVPRAIPTPVFIEVEQLDAGTSPTVDLNPEPAPNQAVTVDLPPEDVVDPGKEWKIVEVMPHPVGGFAKFYQDLGKNLKYPRRALSNGTQGKVFVEFTIEPNGELSNIVVVKGISKECDAEAARVIALSKWLPGKQRGKPVRVRLTQPVVFQQTSN